MPGSGCGARTSATMSRPAKENSCEGARGLDLVAMRDRLEERKEESMSEWIGSPAWFR